MSLNAVYLATTWIRHYNHIIIAWIYFIESCIKTGFTFFFYVFLSQFLLILWQLIHPMFRISIGLFFAMCFLVFICRIVIKTSFVFVFGTTENTQYSENLNKRIYIFCKQFFEIFNMQQLSQVAVRNEMPLINIVYIWKV